MSVVIGDGFDHYTTILDKWDSQFGMAISSSGGRFSSGGLGCAAATGYATRNIATMTEAYFGFAVNVQSIAAEDVWASLLYVYDAATSTFPFWIGVRTDGIIEIGQSDGNSLNSRTVLATSDESMSFAAWHYIEGRIKIDASVGVAEVKVDGSVVATFSGDTVKGSCSSFSQVALGGLTGFSHARTISWDDFVVDDAGYLGDVTVGALDPISAGSNAEFTPSASPNWAQVDDVAPDGDGSFVWGDTVGQKDSYEFSNIDAAAGTVYAVIANLDLEKIDPGSRTVSPLVVSGTYSGTGPTIVAPSSYKIMQSVMNVNPITATTWSVTEVNTSEFGQIIET